MTGLPRAASSADPQDMSTTGDRTERALTDRATAEATAVLAALREVGSGIDGYRRAVASRLGLATADVVTIGLLHREEPLRAGQIGERTGLTPGSVTALLYRLEDRGYLTRTRADHDRRGLDVHLTPAGRALGDELVAVLLPPLASIVEDLGSDGCAALVGVLEKIATALVVVTADYRLSERFAT